MKTTLKLATGIALLTGAAAAHAVVISLGGSNPGQGTTSTFQNNDFSTATVDAGSTDILDVTKEFGTLLSLAFNGSFDGSGTVSVRETIANNTSDQAPPPFTGGDWLDYHLEIAFSVSDACRNAVATVCDDGLSLTNFSNDAGFTATQTGNSISLAGATVAMMGSFGLSFDLVVTSDFGEVSWTITQWPTLDGGRIPEPATLALFGLGLAGLGVRRKLK